MWNDLTFNFGDTLPSSDMNSIQDNLSSFAAGESGAPPIKIGAFTNNGINYPAAYYDYVANGAVYYLPSGILTVSTNGYDFALEINVGGAWRTVAAISPGFGVVLSNSSDVRVRNVSGTGTNIVWKRLE